MNNSILDKTIFATIFLLPIVPAFVKIGPINLANIVVAFCILVSILYSARFELKRCIAIITPYWIFVTYMSIRALTDDTFVHFLQYNLIAFVIPIIIISYINTREKFEKSINCLICGALPLCIYGIFEAVTHINVFQLMAPDNWYFSDVRYGLLRIMTTFGQPIVYGSYLMFVTALILYQLRNLEACKKRRFYKFVLRLVIINLLLTVSRGPIFLTLFFVYCFYFKFRKEQNYISARITYILKTLLLGVLGLTVYISMNPDSTFLSDTFALVNDIVNGTSISNESGVGIGDRVNLSSYVFYALGDNVLWGAGFDSSFEYEVHSWQIKKSIENNYLNIWYHTGFIGCALLVFCYIGSLFYSYRKSIKEKLWKGNYNISFNYTIFLLFFTYYIELLSCQETDMMRMYAIIISLLIAYNKNRLYEYEQKS